MLPGFCIDTYPSLVVEDSIKWVFAKVAFLFELHLQVASKTVAELHVIREGWSVEFNVILVVLGNKSEVVTELLVWLEMPIIHLIVVDINKRWSSVNMIIAFDAEDVVVLIGAWSFRLLRRIRPRYSWCLLGLRTKVLLLFVLKRGQTLHVFLL